MKVLITLFLISIASAVSAQKIKYNRGFVVLQNGDTISGSVSWKKHADAAEIIFVKTKETAEPAKYHWDDLIAAYDADHKRTYKICNIRRELEYLERIDYIIKFKDSAVTETIPLREVYKGNYFALYHFKDQSDHFFISNGKELFELVEKYRYLTEEEKVSYRSYIIPRYYVLSNFRSQFYHLYNFELDKKMKSLLSYTIREESSLVQLLSKIDSRLEKPVND